MTKRLLSMLLAIIMVVGMLPVTGSAATVATVHQNGTVNVADLKVNDIICANVTITGAPYVYYGIPLYHKGSESGNWTPAGTYIVTEVFKENEHDAIRVDDVTAVVTLDANGGTVTPSTLYLLLDETGPLPVPTREGYTFTGWKTMRDLVTTEYHPTLIADRDQTLVAQWESEKFQITTKMTGNANDTWCNLSVSYNGNQNATEAAAGDWIAITANCSSPYTLESVKFYKTNDPTTGVTVVTPGNKYQMPAYDITVEAVFDRQPVELLSINFSSHFVTLKRNQTITLTPNIYPLDHTDTLVWSSSNPSVATVNENGIVTAHSAGQAVIQLRGTAKPHIYDAVTVTVEPLNDSKYFFRGYPGPQNGDFLVNGRDGNFQIELGTTVTVTPQPHTGFEVDQVYYRIGDSSGTKVDIEKDANGLYTFTMTDNAPHVFVTFKRKAPTTVAVENVSLDKTSTTLTVGGTETLTATVEPGNATNKNVSWTSGNTEVATVDATGVVTAVGAGNATITVTTEDGSKTATCTVTVTAAAVDPSTEITKEPTQNGSFEATYNAENDTVTVTPTPAEGYEVDKVTYTPADGTETEVTPVNGVYSFSKPDGKITVKVLFKETAPAGHFHSINGSEGDQKWIPVSSLDEITTSGYYCLENDVSHSGNWEPISGTVLCLNGHSINFNGSGYVNLSFKTFTLTDCVPNGNVGKITGGNAASNKGGGVHISSNATFTMYGGTITGNTASGGAGVYVNNSTSKFNLYGGTITGNTYTTGGDVYLGSGAKMEVAGSPIIGRVYLASPDEIPIVIGAGGLHNGTSITVSTVGGKESANVAAANDTDYSTYFHSWKDTYAVSYDADKVIRLAKAAPITVKFLIEQNGKFKEVQVAKNATLTAPTLAEVAEMPGYTLEGWYKDRHTFENAWDFATDTATQNLTLYAKLKLNPADIQCAGNYTGIYDGQNHSISVTASHNAYDNMPNYFTYQWYKGETPETATEIDGANAGTYSVKNAADSGTYYCKVTASDKAFIYSPEELAVTSEAWSDPITVTISKQEVTPPTIDSKVFNENTQTADVPTSDLYTVKQNNGGIDAGSYDVILTLTDSANYTWPNFDTADYEMQFVIEPADQAALEITGLPATAAYEDTFMLTTSGGSGDGSVSWAVTNGPATVDASTGTVTITGVGDITIQATKAGTQNYNEATATVTFTSVKATQEKPNGLTPTQETIAGMQDGKITGVNSNMEYKLKGADNYIPIDNVTVLENLPSGTYLIRFKADENHEASEDVEITVQQGKMLTVTLPTVQTGYTLKVKDNGSNEVPFSGSIVLTYELAEGYTEGTDFAVNATYGTVTANPDGTYTISGIEQDTTVSVTGVRDITAPTAEIVITTNKWTEFLNTITFDLFFKQTQTVTIDAQDAGSGVKTIEYYLSETEMTLDAVKAITAWEGYNGSFSIDAERNYVIYAKVTDKAENDGNTVYINSNGIVMDKTAPIFSGVTDGNEYYTTQKVTVTETNLLSLTCNGFAVESPITLEGNKDFTYEIVATDKAGNSSKITVVMNPVENLAAPLPEDTTLELDDKEEIEALKENVSSIWANNLSNITDEEEAALQAIIARCDALLQIIANVNNVNDQIKALKAPAEISPDEIDVILAYDDALEAYEKLTKRGKELVDTNELAKLEAVGKALTAYDVIKGHKSSYVKGSFKTISIVANGYYDVFGKYADGAFGKFREVRIDGEFLNPQYYTAASGSTVITLKTSYLESLETGKHYIQFVYVDGSTDGNDYFRVSVNNGSPITGDNSHILMFTGMAVTSLLCAAMLIVFFPRKKGKYER